MAETRTTKTHHYQLYHVNIQDVKDEIDGLDEIEDESYESQLSNLRKLELAKTFLRAGHDLVQQVVGDTKDENAQAYLVDHLKISIGDHSFLSRDLNVDKLIERLLSKMEAEKEAVR
jgi:hypothetical protein